MITIGLADDNFATLKRFTNYFQKKGWCNSVIQAENGYQLILKLLSLKKIPDIVFLDINMPVIDGVSITYYLKVHYSSIKLIALSNYEDEDSLKNMFLSGADGFVFKVLAENVLEDAIKAIRNNKIYIDTRIDFDTNQIPFILNKRKLRLDNFIEFGLTKREWTFIQLNVTTLTYEQIANIMCVEEKTIHTYFDRISKKINVRSRHELALFSLQNGLATIASFN
jgi:DNA-binding NarL/FixJ family response regulator